MATMGRPLVDIDQKLFETLCGFQCTLAEIADHFDVTEDSVIRWCKRTYNETFSSVFEKKRGKGLTSLRRKQFQVAMDGNPAMLIFLGKNWLGQSDKPDSSAITFIQNNNTANITVVNSLLEKTYQQLPDAPGDLDEAYGVGNMGDILDDLDEAGNNDIIDGKVVV